MLGQRPLFTIPYLNLLIYYRKHALSKISTKNLVAIVNNDAEKEKIYLF